MVTFGAVIIVAACFLQWWQLGGDVANGELTAHSDIGIGDIRGFLLFLTGVATLLLITLPYAADAPIAIDRPLSFVALLCAALVLYALRTFNMLQQGLLLDSGKTPPLQPLRGIGFWIAGLGLLVFARGVFELWDARRRF